MYEKYDNMKIQLINLVIDTTVDGPGWRTSVYCAGCKHACKGCHNPETWSFNAGEAISADELFDRIAMTEGNITFSGGDPMYQAEAFTYLAKRITKELKRTIWCYSGFLFEDIVKDPVMSQMLPYLEVLVDGPFIEDLRDTNLLFRGSSNQRLIDVAKSLEKGEVVLFEYSPYPEF